ncbi:hypothetical protein BC940DRAFT_335296 [Gongronella butleri]|nr:hypothetical protein BC940DRAFT_335296 [Gongronella butleri]
MALPVHSPTVISWGAMLSAAASMAYANRRPSQDDAVMPRQQRRPSVISISSVSTTLDDDDDVPAALPGHRPDLHLLTFVLGKE